MELAAPLLRMPGPGVVDDEPAHHPRGVRHEPVTVGEPFAFLLRQVEVGLVEQARGAERHAPPLAAQLALGDPVQLGVQRREERRAGRSIAPIGQGKQRRK